MKWRVVSKSGWYLRLLEGVDDKELDDGDGEGEDDGENAVVGVSVGSVDDDSELDESQLDRRSWKN
jgi:hypothetical protein